MLKRLGTKKIDGDVGGNSRFRSRTEDDSSLADLLSRQLTKPINLVKLAPPAEKKVDDDKSSHSFASSDLDKDVVHDLPNNEEIRKYLKISQMKTTTENDRNIFRATVTIDSNRLKLLETA